MKSIQDLFRVPQFATANSAVVQKLRDSKKNFDAMALGYTQHWPNVHQQFDLLVLAFEDEDSQKRRLYAGYLTDVEFSFEGVVYGKNRDFFRLYADRFIEVGVHDRALISDAQFYGTKGGGGSRVKVLKRGAQAQSLGNVKAGKQAPPGAMEQRLRWVRLNHDKFRKPVVLHWGDQCAVYGHSCDGLLVASHIYPWHRSDGKQKTDVHNGLLLSAPLDRLFDRGFIAFSESGAMLKSKHVSQHTCRAFGLGTKTLSLDTSRITRPMKK